MKRRRAAFLAFGLASAMASAAPRLAVPPGGIAFGEVCVGSNVVGRAVLRNEGDAAVSVSRVKACCGATAELSATRIPPKGSAVLSVSLAVRDAGAFSKSVQVTCDDPERPLVSVPVSGIAVESGPAAAEGSSPPPPRPCEGAAGLSVAASLVVGAALSLWRGRRRSPRCSSCSSSPSRRRPCADSTSRAAASAARPPAAWSPPSSATRSCWPSPSGWRLAADRAAGEPLAFFLVLYAAAGFDILLTQIDTECLQQETESDEKAFCHFWHLWLVRRFV